MVACPLSSSAHSDSCRETDGETLRANETNEPSGSAETTTLRGAVLLILILAVAWACVGQRLLQRPFWMDELHSWLLITDPDVEHAMSALADGADYNPPTYYLVARLLKLFGPITEFRLRLLSLGVTVSTLLAVYLMLVRRFSITASLGATLAAAGHPLLILQATEARFYALWLCLLMWYCWLLTSRIPTTAAGWKRTAGLMFLAAAICTTHYFGMISVGLVTAAWAAVHRRDRSVIRQSAGLMVVVGTTVAACLPMLKGQQAALTCATWVKSPTIAGSFDFMTQFVPALPLAICLCCAAAAWFMRQQTTTSIHSGSFRNDAPWSVENSVLASLLLHPLVLITFSWLVQPALIDRYAIVSVVGTVPVYVWLLSKSTLVMQRSAVGVAGTLLVLSIQHGADTWDYSLHQQQTLQQSLNELPADCVVVFEDRIDFWLLQHQTAPARHWYQVDFETSDLLRSSNLRIVQRDVGRRIAKWYPDRFPMMPLQELNDASQVVVVPYRNHYVGQLKYPETFCTKRLSNGLIRLTRNPEMIRL
ncbi:MAG: glycosyltransferase family 39 protein [Planctomycetaceae bacterium]